MLGLHVLAGAEIPVCNLRQREDEQQRTEDGSRAEGVPEHPAVPVVLRREGDGHGLQPERAEADWIRDADRDIVDREHHLRLEGGPSHERGNHQRGDREDEGSERERQHEAELSRHQQPAALCGEEVVDVAVPRQRTLRRGELAHVGPRVGPGEDPFDEHADRHRGESPPRTDQSPTRQQEGKKERESDAHERRVVGLAAFQVVVEDDERHVAEEEPAVHDDAPDQRPSRDLRQFRRQVEESLEDPDVERMDRGHALQDQERDHQVEVEPPERLVPAPVPRVDESRHDETAAQESDHEHDGLPLRKPRQRIYPQRPVRHDARHQRIRNRLRKRLQQERHVEPRHPSNRKLTFLFNFIHFPPYSVSSRPRDIILIGPSSRTIEN